MRKRLIAPVQPETAPPAHDWLNLEDLVEVVGHDLVRHDPHGVEDRHTPQDADELLLHDIPEGPVLAGPHHPVVAVMPRIPVVRLQSRLSHVSSSLLRPARCEPPGKRRNEPSVFPVDSDTISLSLEGLFHCPLRDYFTVP